MTTRERSLAIFLCGFIVFLVVGIAGYMFVYSPLQAKKMQAARLANEVAELDEKLEAWSTPDNSKGGLSRAERLSDMKVRSLPTVEADTKKLTEYQRTLEKLLKDTKIAGTVNVRTPETRSAPSPFLSGKKPAFTKVAYTVTFDKVPLKTVGDFLAAYDRINLLHQITSMTIKRSENKDADNRADLSVTLVTEALIMDGAPPQRSPLFAPLSTPARDYSSLIARDIFHGPLPPLKIGKLPDISVALGKPLPAVKIPLIGDVTAIGRTIVTTELKENSIIEPNGISIDPSAQTLTIAPIEKKAGTAIVNVVATAADGRTDKQSFKIAITEAVETVEVTPEVPRVKDDTSFAVLLVGICTRSDGSAVALIRDQVNKHNYEISSSAKGISVTRFRYLSPKRDKFEKDEKYGDGGSQTNLIFSEGIGSHDRSFRVVAVEHDSLILSDMKPTPKALPPKARRPGPGPAPALEVEPATPSGSPVSAAPSSLAAVTGLALASASPPQLQRWVPGKSLKALTAVPPDEVWKLLRQMPNTSPEESGVVAAE